MDRTSLSLVIRAERAAIEALTRALRDDEWRQKILSDVAANVGLYTIQAEGQPAAEWTFEIEVNTGDKSDR